MAIITLVTLTYFPMGFIEYPVGWTFDVERNITVLDVLPSTDTMVLLVGSIYNAVNGTVIPFVKFFAVVLCTILLSLSLQKSKAWRKKNKNTSSKEPAPKAWEGAAYSAVLFLSPHFLQKKSQILHPKCKILQAEKGKLQ